MAKATPVRILAMVQGLEGKWVAILDSKVVAAGETFDSVYSVLGDRGEGDATILRVPGEGEPEPVGLG